MDLQNLQYQEMSEILKKTRCGCYAVNSQLAKQYPNKYVLVPLKSSEYEIDIVNSIANFTLVQTYQNPTNKFLQLYYSFPINPNACVYRFVAEFGTTRIEGVVKEKEEAKVQYEEAVRQGKRAAYGELNAQSKDIFNLKIGNVAPAQRVKIEIVYLQELTLSCNMFYQLHMTGTISPRYMNHIPLAAIDYGLRNQAAKAEGKFYWNFKISLRTSRKVQFFDSNTHDIELVSQNDSRTHSVFAMAKSSVPSKDFVFSYSTEDYQLPSYVFGRTDAGSTAMISFIPKFCSLSVDDAYKASVAGKSFETEIGNANGEYIFLLDRSGSMGGKRIEKAKEALILFIKSLPQDTYFNIVSFGSGSQTMFKSSVKYNDKEINAAVKDVKKMSADMGGTQIYQPLAALLNEKPIDGYPKQIFLLTDGGVSNTEEVIRMVAKNNKYSRVYAIGIGNGCSEQLILGCSQKGKGYHVFITDEEEPSQKIIQLLTDSLSPVISRMKLSYDKNLVESVIPNPESLPYILKNELVNFYITFKGQLDSKAKIELTYQDSLNKMPYKSEIEIDPGSQSESFIDRMGNFKKIRLLQQSHRNNSNLQELMYYVKLVDKKGEIVKESVKHQILSQLTAFICVEKELIDGKYQQIKDTGKVKVQIVNPRPIEYQHQQKRQTMKKTKTFFKNSTLKSPQQQSLNCNSLALEKGFKMNPNNLEKKKQQSKKKSQIQDQCFQERQDQIQQQIMKIQEKRQRIQEKRKQRQKANQKCLEIKKQQIPMMKKQMIMTEIKQIQQPKKSAAEKLSISEIISYQSSQGSWSDLKLIGTLFGKDVETKISGQKDLVAVITYLVSKWIEKNHPEKQYSLVVKKGLNYVKKIVQYIKTYGELYDNYIK